MNDAGSRRNPARLENPYARLFVMEAQSETEGADSQRDRTLKEGEHLLSSPRKCR
jgi:hypothetical protein